MARSVFAPMPSQARWRRLDLPVGEEFGQPVAASERQHGGQRVELDGAPRLRIGRLRRPGVGRGLAGGGGEGGHCASRPRTVTLSAAAAAASLLSRVASGACSRKANSR